MGSVPPKSLPVFFTESNAVLSTCTACGVFLFIYSAVSKMGFGLLGDADNRSPLKVGKSERCGVAALTGRLGAQAVRPVRLQSPEPAEWLPGLMTELA